MPSVRTDETGGDGHLTHLDAQGRARMVDVTAKPLTHRVAMAKCSIVTRADTVALLADAGALGERVEDARVAGMQAAKLTSSLIPLCHSIRIDRVAIDLAVVPQGVEVSAVTEIVERTGVEMEALTACAVAGLTLLAAVIGQDPEASMEDLTLWHKSGGRTGDWHRVGTDSTLQRKFQQISPPRRY
jgi:cyclic pyranopterin phosphate synthase